MLGDERYNDSAIDAACAQAGQTVVATRRGPYAHTDDGVDVRRILHELRSRAIENLNEQFKGIFDAHGQVPTKGLGQHDVFILNDEGSSIRRGSWDWWCWPR